MLYRKRHHGCRWEEYLWNGHRLIVLENESLRIGILTSRGADIVELRWKKRDLDLLWHAPQQILPPGQQPPTLASRRGSFFDHYSGGWQEVFPSAGSPSEYLGAEYGVHGEVCLLPWDVRVVRDDPDQVDIEFSVETRRSPFRIVRTMSLAGSAPVLRFFESVTNLGDERVHFMWGHHPTLGQPFLEAGCRIDLPQSQWTPQHTDDLKHRFAANKTLQPLHPSSGCETDDPTYVLSREARTDDVLLFRDLEKGWCAVRNPRLKLGICLCWDKEVFPYLWCWQSFGGLWGYPYYGRNYVLGVEPFNCPALPFAECVARKIAPALEAGQTIQTRMDTALFESDVRVIDAGYDGELVFE